MSRSKKKIIKKAIEFLKSKELHTCLQIHLISFGVVLLFGYLISLLVSFISFDYFALGAGIGFSYMLGKDMVNLLRKIL